MSETDPQPTPESPPKRRGRPPSPKQVEARAPRAASSAEVPLGLRRWESVPITLLGELYVDGKRWAFRIPLLEVVGYGETPDMARHQATCQVKQMDADARE